MARDAVSPLDATAAAEEPPAFPRLPSFLSDRIRSAIGAEDPEVSLYLRVRDIFWSSLAVGDMSPVCRSLSRPFDIS